jgi:hypothetical protein
LLYFTAVREKMISESTDRVLIMLPDGWDFAPAFAGVIGHGAMPRPINPLLPAHYVLGTRRRRKSPTSAALWPIPIDALADLDAEPSLFILGHTGLGSRAATALKRSHSCCWSAPKAHTVLSSLSGQACPFSRVADSMAAWLGCVLWRSGNTAHEFRLLSPPW